MRRVYVEDGCDIARELYLGAVIDRADGRLTLMASTEGGVEIEEVAARTPEKIHKVAIDPAIGFQPFHGRQIAFGLGLEGKQVSKAVAFMRGVCRAFTELRRQPDRDQSAGGDGRAATWSRSTPR